MDFVYIAGSGRGPTSRERAQVSFAQAGQAADLVLLDCLARALMALAVRHWDGGPCMGSHTHHGGTCALEEGDAFEGIDTSYGDALRPNDIAPDYQCGICGEGANGQRLHCSGGCSQDVCVHCVKDGEIVRWPEESEILHVRLTCHVCVTRKELCDKADKEYREDKDPWGTLKRFWRQLCLNSGQAEVEALTQRVYNDLLTGDEPYDVVFENKALAHCCFACKKSLDFDVQKQHCFACGFVSCWDCTGVVRGYPGTTYNVGGLHGVHPVCVYCREHGLHHARPEYVPLPCSLPVVEEETGLLPMDSVGIIAHMGNYVQTEEDFLQVLARLQLEHEWSSKDLTGYYRTLLCPLPFPSSLRTLSLAVQVLCPRGPAVLLPLCMGPSMLRGELGVVCPSSPTLTMCLTSRCGALPRVVLTISKAALRRLACTTHSPALLTLLATWRQAQRLHKQTHRRFQQAQRQQEAQRLALALPAPSSAAVQVEGEVELVSPSPVVAQPLPPPEELYLPLPSSPIEAATTSERLPLPNAMDAAAEESSQAAIAPPARVEGAVPRRRRRSAAPLVAQDAHMARLLDDNTMQALLSQPGVRELVEAEVTRHQAHNTRVLRDMLQAANLENGQLQTQIEAMDQQMAEIQRHLGDQWGARRFFEALALPGEEAILGEGAFGKVFQIVTQAHGRIAVKFMRFDPDPDKRETQHYVAENELKALEVVQGLDFSVKVHYAYVDSDGCGIAMELLDHTRTIDQIITAEGYVPQREMVRSVVSQGLRMVKKLRARDLVHRDVKTENLILQLTGQLKMIDFGVACIEASTSEHVWCGTPWAGAPEMTCADPDVEQGVSHALDLFGMGVVGYCLLMSRRMGPYEDDTVAALALFVDKQNMMYADSEKREAMKRVLIADLCKARTRLTQAAATGLLDDSTYATLRLMLDPRPSQRMRLLSMTKTEWAREIEAAGRDVAQRVVEIKREEEARRAHGAIDVSRTAALVSMLGLAMPGAASHDADALVEGGGHVREEQGQGIDVEGTARLVGMLGLNTGRLSTAHNEAASLPPAVRITERQAEGKEGSMVGDAQVLPPSIHIMDKQEQDGPSEAPQRTPVSLVRIPSSARGRKARGASGPMPEVGGQAEEGRGGSTVNEPATAALRFMLNMTKAPQQPVIREEGKELTSDEIKTGPGARADVSEGREGGSKDITLTPPRQTRDCVTNNTSSRHSDAAVKVKGQHKLNGQTGKGAAKRQSNNAIFKEVDGKEEGGRAQGAKGQRGQRAPSVASCGVAVGGVTADSLRDVHRGGRNNGQRGPGHVSRVSSSGRIINATMEVYIEPPLPPAIHIVKDQGSKGQGEGRGHRDQGIQQYMQTTTPGQQSYEGNGRRQGGQQQGRRALDRTEVQGQGQGQGRGMRRASSSSITPSMDEAAQDGHVQGQRGHRGHKQEDGREGPHRRPIQPRIADTTRRMQGNNAQPSNSQRSNGRARDGKGQQRSGCGDGQEAREHCSGPNNRRTSPSSAITATARVPAELPAGGWGVDGQALGAQGVYGYMWR